jgi:membrane glycosyltransferase
MNPTFSTLLDIISKTASATSLTGSINVFPFVCVLRISRHVLTSIEACANGEVAPFVGHNAFLRWRALQDCSFIDPWDKKEKIWSEENVSEDFDMAMRLIKGSWAIRWATYSNGGFKEGVSLTVDDELNRWQKYAYGTQCLLYIYAVLDHLA